MGPDPARFKARDGWALAALAAGLLALFLAIARREGGPLLRRAPDQFYAYSTDAVLSGQLALKVAPPPELLKLSNPYDGLLNAPYRARDLSLYRGKYYFYFGIAPVVVLLAPLKLLTGRFLSESGAAAVFGALGLALAAAILLRVRRTLLAGTPRGQFVLATAFVVLGSTAGCNVMASGVYGVPIAAAFCFQTAAMGCVLLALQAPSRAGIWFALAGVSMGLVLGSRPNEVFGTVAFLVPIGWLAAREAGSRRWRPLATAGCAFGLPVALAIAALIIMNLRRFGSPFEFGFRYQLTTSGQLNWRFFSLGYVPARAREYFGAAPVLSPAFPFVVAGSLGLIGMAVTLPAALLGFGSFARRTPAVLRAFAATAASVAAVIIATNLCFNSAVFRYLMDFVPLVCLFGALGGLALGTPAVFGTKGRLAAGAAFVASGAAALLVHCHLWDALSEANRRMLLPAAWVANLPYEAFERVAGRAWGPIEATVVVPRARTGAYEPVVGTGIPGYGGELVYLHYLNPGQLQVGFFQTGHCNWLSDPVAGAAGSRHILRVEMGSLLPPETSSAYRGWNPEQVAAARQTLRLWWDGKVVQEARLDFLPSSPGQLRMGENTIAPDACGPRFFGTIEKVARLPIARPAAAIPVGPRYGAWRLKVRFAEGPLGRREPLVTTGVPELGNFIFAFHDGPGRLIFGADKWGEGGPSGPPVAVSMSQPHLLVISCGAFYPPLGSPAWGATPPAEQRRLKGTIRITLDGAVVLESGFEPHESSPDTVMAGRNTIGGSTAASEFAGRILSARRLDFP